ncbi:MAG: LysM domain-containing protein [Dysosmobacter sp.]
MKIHVVRAGESVWSIASDYGVDPDRLAADNEVPPAGHWRWGRRW